MIQRERRRRQLGFGYGNGYGSFNPFYDRFRQPDRNNDFTPKIYIRDYARPSVPRPVNPRPVTPKPQRPTTSMVQPVMFGDLCPPSRDDDLNIDQLPVFFLADPKDWSSMGADRPLTPGQSGSNNRQPAFIIVPGVFLATSEDSKVTQHTNGLKAPDILSITESNRKPKDC